jgi:hypothetical protein
MDTYTTAALLVITLVSIFFAIEEILTTKKTTALLRQTLKEMPKAESIFSPKKNMKTLDQLIAETKGKFFSITFTKANGSVRTINGKDVYKRLLVGGKFTASEKGYIPFINRNAPNILNKKGGGWVCAHKDEVVKFKCGKIQTEFSNI